MTTDYDDFGFAEDEDAFTPDPAIIARMDQESAAFEHERGVFRRIYGFDHQCVCDKDYSSGNMHEVTECYLRLTGEAMDRCQRATAENRVLSSMLDEMLTMNQELVKMLEDLGHEKELADYFQEDVDLDDVSQFQLELEDGSMVEFTLEPEEEPTDDEGTPDN